MRARHSTLLLLIGIALLAAAATCAQDLRKAPWPSDVFNPKSRPHVAGTFDYYTMVMSWSPTHCVTAQEGRDEEQCARIDGLRYGFVLHGLWPQYAAGGGPENCATTDEVDKRTAARALAFMPSRALINHEWRTHGACSGMGPEDYFALADRAFAAVRVPPELRAPEQPVDTSLDALRAAFRRANPNLSDDMMSLHCSRGELVEVRVCLDRNLAPTACGKHVQTRCPATAAITLPASR